MGKTRLSRQQRNTIPTANAPAAAPMRPVQPDEAETAAVRASDPHRVGADRVTKLRADVSAAQQRHAHKKATGRLPAPTKPASKPASKPAAQASSTASAPAFGTAAWRAKYGRKKSAAKPPATQPEGSTYG
jgi:hypothetical protein